MLKYIDNDARDCTREFSLRMLYNAQESTIADINYQAQLYATLVAGRSY